jgi:hypothetical protein
MRATTAEMRATAAEVTTTTPTGVPAATTATTAAVTAGGASDERRSSRDHGRRQDPEGPRQKSRFSLDHDHGFHSVAAPPSGARGIPHVSIRRSVLGSVQAPETANPPFNMTSDVGLFQ